MTKKDWVAAATMIITISIALMMIPVFAMILLVVGIGILVSWEWPLKIRSFIWKSIKKEKTKDEI